MCVEAMPRKMCQVKDLFEMSQASLPGKDALRWARRRVVAFSACTIRRESICLWHYSKKNSGGDPSSKSASDDCHVSTTIFNVRS